MTAYSHRDLPDLMDKIVRNGIGMEDYFERVFNYNEPTTKYPPYNLISVSDTESELEIALAGFRKEDVKVYTENGQLVVKGEKDSEKEEKKYLHKGVAQRSFSRMWTLSEDTEVGSVTFEDGLLSIRLSKIIPDHHKRKEFL